MDWFLYDNGIRHERVNRQSHKIVKYTQKIRRQQPKSCLSVFDVGLALNGLVIRASFCF